MCRKRSNCKWKLEYGKWYQGSRLKLIKPFKEQAWSLLWWNCSGKLEFIEGILYSCQRIIYMSRTYCSETKWVCVTYDAAIHFLFIICVLGCISIDIRYWNNDIDISLLIYVASVNSLPLIMHQFSHHALDFQERQ